MRANPVANGGSLLRDLRLPELAGLRGAGRPARRDTARGHAGAQRRAARRHPAQPPRNFLTFTGRAGQQRLGDMLEITGRDWQASVERVRRAPGSARPGHGGALRAHLPRLLEGYLLSGRHGVFTCYEAFIHVIDSMFNQHAKWLEKCNELPWRRPLSIAQLPADPRTSGGRTTTGSPTRTPASSTW